MSLGCLRREELIGALLVRIQHTRQSPGKGEGASKGSKGDTSHLGGPIATSAWLASRSRFSYSKCQTHM